MRRRDRYAAYLASAAIATGLFAVGGAPRWAALLAAAVASATLLPAIRSRREPTAISPLLWFLIAAAGLTLLQVIPLPSALVGLLSPAKLELVKQNAVALDRGAPSFTAISMDPPATLVELAKLLGYVLFAYTCLRVASHDKGRRWLTATVAVCGGVMALIAVLHEVAHLHKLYGAYTPQRATSFMAPLLNPNHLAAFLALTTPVALGLAVGASFRARVGWVLVAIVCAGVCLLTQSRGGAVALVIGVVVAAIGYTVQRQRGDRPRGPLGRADSLALVITGVSLLLLFGLFTAGGAIREIQSTSSSELRGDHGKIKAWKASKVLLRDHRWTGVGRGGFEPAFTRVPASERITFSHLENEYLQAAVDWGIPGAALLAVLLVMTMLAARKHNRGSPIDFGIFGGLTAILVQSAVDFGLSLPGIALATIALASVVCARPLTAARRRGLVPARVVAFALVAITIAIAASPLGRTARDDTDAVERAIASGADADEVLRDAIRAHDQHPSDYVAAGLVAKALFAKRDRRAVAVANRALSMHPRHSDLHHLTAVMLSVSQRPQQAMLEYSLAISYARKPHDLVDEVLARFPRPEDAVQALPVDRRLGEALIRVLLSRKRLDVARLYLERYVDANPSDLTAQLRRAELAGKDGDTQTALGAARAAYAMRDNDETAIALVTALTGAGELDEAETLVRTITERTNLSDATRTHLLVAVAGLQIERGQLERARAILMSTLDRGGDQAEVHRLLAIIEERLGNTHQANWWREQAEETSSDPADDPK